MKVVAIVEVCRATLEAQMDSLLDTLAGTGATHSLPTKTNGHAVLNGLRVVRYDASNDVQAQWFLPWLWERMKADDLTDYYFPGQRDTGFATFTRLFSGDAQVGLFAIDAPSKQWEDTIPGFITWSVQRWGASEVIVAGFIFFRKFWDHATTDECAKVAFDYWFRDTPAKVVLGVCPSEHVAAMRYNKRIGLREIGRIPEAHLFKGKPCDAVLMAMTREEWTKGGHD
jgi:RimJ/RimL family protein N-acetyltransferase